MNSSIDRHDKYLSIKMLQKHLKTAKTKLSHPHLHLHHSTHSTDSNPDQSIPLLSPHDDIVSDDIKPKIISIPNNSPLPIDIKSDEMLIYNNYMLNEHNEKIEVFDRFVSSLEDANDTEFGHIKSFCNSLTDNNIIHMLIKYMFAKYCKTPDLNIYEIYDKVLQDIFEHDFSDCTLKSTDGKTYKCLKIVLEQIPFIKIMFEEFKEFQNEMEIDADSEMAEIMIKMVYKSDVTDLITIDNVCKVLNLIDRWLMNIDCINILIPFLGKNIEDIITKRNYDEISAIANILVHSKEDAIANIVTKIYSHDYGEHIFKFSNWQNVFSEEHKLNAIISSSKYELLNMANICPKKVIKFLENSNLTDICDIFEMTNDKNVLIYFHDKLNNDLKYDANVSMLIIIDEYYPQFRFTIFTKTYLSFKDPNGIKYDINRNVLVMTHPLMKISTGKQLLIGDNIISICKKDPVIVTDTTYNNNEIKNYYYELSGKTLHYEGIRNDGRVWTINKFCYDVHISAKNIGIGEHI